MHIKDISAKQMPYKQKLINAFIKEELKNADCCYVKTTDLKYIWGLNSYNKQETVNQALKRLHNATSCGVGNSFSAVVKRKDYGT